MNTQKKISDIELVHALKRGDETAFNELFDCYANRLLRFSMSYLRKTEEAEEIVQEVFLKIWNCRVELDSERSLNSFLFTIARNAILNTIRKTKAEQVYVQYAMLNPGKNILLDEELDFQELKKAYDKAIEKLSPRRKEIYILRKVQNLSNEEVASRLGISVKTVENQMTASLSEIRKVLRTMGFSGIVFFELFL